jgi:hypothetical protein
VYAVDILLGVEHVDHSLKPDMVRHRHLDDNPGNLA